MAFIRYLYVEVLLNAAHMNKDGIYPFNERRSSIEVGPLEIKNGTLVSERNKPFDFWLTAPEEKK